MLSLVNGHARDAAGSGVVTLRTLTPTWVSCGGTARDHYRGRVQSAGVPRAVPNGPAFHRALTSGRRDHADWETSAGLSRRRSGGSGLRRRASFASACRDAPAVRRYALADP